MSRIRAHLIEAVRLAMWKLRDDKTDIGGTVSEIVTHDRATLKVTVIDGDSNKERRFYIKIWEGRPPGYGLR